MKCWNRFDDIAVVTYTGYAKRFARMCEELYDVGINHDRVQVQRQFPTPFNEIIMANISLQSTCRHVGSFNCTMAHYRCLKTAYELGKEHLLVMEDDCRWLHNLCELEHIVDALPADYDYAKFEWFFGKGQTPEERTAILAREKINDCWIDAHGVKAVGAAACAYSRKGMKWKIDLIEDAAKRPGIGKLRIIDMYDRPWPLGENIRAYLALPLAAVQAAGDSMHENMKDYTGIRSKESYGA